MRRLGRLEVSLEGLLALACVVALSLGGVRCAAYREGGDDARLAQLESNAYKSSLAGIASRHRADSVTRLVTARITSNRKARVRLSARLTANDSLLSDTVTSHDSIVSYPSRLRDALAQTTEVARVYRDSTDVLLDAVESLIVAHEAERAANTKLVAAQNNLISALTARECRVLGMRCPSRRTAFAAGVVTTLGVIVAVAR